MSGTSSTAIGRKCNVDRALKSPKTQVVNWTSNGHHTARIGEFRSKIVLVTLDDVKPVQHLFTLANVFVPGLFCQPIIADASSASHDNEPVFWVRLDEVLHQLFGFGVLKIDHFDAFPSEVIFASHKGIVLAHDYARHLVENASSSTHITWGKRSVHGAPLVRRGG